MHKIIEFNKKNKNGRTYVYHEINPLPENMMLPCCLDLPGEHLINGAVNLNSEIVGALAKLSLNSEGLFADFIILGNKSGKLLEQMLVEGYVPVPMGYGTLNEEGIVEGYSLICLYLTKDPS